MNRGGVCVWGGGGGGRGGEGEFREPHYLLCHNSWMTLVIANFSNMNIYELFCKFLQNTTDVIIIYDSSDYYKSRQRVITIYDRYLITNHDNCYYNLRETLQFTTLLQFTTVHTSCLCNWTVSVICARSSKAVTLEWVPIFKYLDR